MKMIKKLVMFALALAIVLPLLAVTETVGGYTWTYRLNGDTAEIFNNYSAAISPSPNGAVTIPSTLGGKPVTSIGNRAFYNCSGLTSVTIPSNVKNIDSWAFYGNSSLLAFDVDGGNTVFSSANGLLLSKDGKTLIQGVNGDVMIPDSVTGIGEFAFNSCSGLTRVTIPENVTNIGWFAFSDCSGLTSMTIPDNVANIDGSAFSRCSGLTNVVIGLGVTNVGSSAFAYCSGLKSFEVADGNPSYKSVSGFLLSKNGTTLVSGVNCVGTVPDNVTNIMEYAFSGRNELESITIPSNVTDIGNLAFAECHALKHIAIPNNVTDIGDYAFAQCHALERIVIPSNVTTIGTASFNSCSNLTDVVISDGVTNIKGTSFQGCSSLTEIVIPNSVTNIGGAAFYRCENLRHVTMSVNVKTIDAHAFGNCSRLTSMTLPSSVDNIGESAFEKCSRLETITFNGNAPSVAQNAFAGVKADCTAYVRRGSTGWGVVIPGTWNGIRIDYYPQENVDGFTFVNGVLTSVDLNGRTDVAIPNGVTAIGMGVFSNCTELVSVTIPNSVTNIGMTAFYGCSSIASMMIPDGVTDIGIEAFRNCSGLTNVTIGSSVTSIGNHAFFGCNGLTSISIPNSVTTIGSYAFCGCRELASVTIPASVRNIGMGAFYNCGGLTNVLFLGNAPTVGSSAFGRVNDQCTAWVFSDTTGWEVDIPGTWNGMRIDYKDPQFTIVEGTLVEVDLKGATEVVIPNGVTTIGEGVFSNCTELASITIPNSVTNMEKNAFVGCTGLREVRIFDLAAWCGNSFGNYAGNPIYYAKNLYVNDVFVTDLVIPNGVTMIPNYAFYGCTNITSVTIPHGVTKIGNYAFASCSGMSSVMFPDGMMDIGSFAFSSCTGLTVVTIPENVTNIGSYAFLKCSGLANVTIAASVTNIGNYAFYNCSGLTNLLFCGNTPNIGRDVFTGVNDQCTAWVFSDTTGWGVDIPGTWNGMRIDYKDPQFTIVEGTLVEVDLKGATEVVIPNGVTTIGEGVFSNCTELASVTIPNSVTNMDKNAFVGCTGLREVRIFDLAAWCGMSFGNSAGNPIYYAKTLYVNDVLVTDLVIPDGVTMIPGGAFYGCTNITSVTMSYGVTNIDASAFYGCDGLTSMAIPDGVTSIGARAFGQCFGLTNIIFFGDAPTIRILPGIGVTRSCTAWVFRGSTGWGVEIPGTWKGMQIKYLDEDPIPYVFADTPSNTVIQIIGKAGFADVGVNAAIGGNAATYMAFKSWAGNVKNVAGDVLAGEAAVVANAHAATAFLLGTERLLENVPEIEIDEVAVGEQNGGTTFGVAVTVKDGADAVRCAAEKVKGMFKATHDLGDWDGAAKLTPSVTIETADGATMRFTVNFGNEMVPRAFLRIRK